MLVIIRILCLLRSTHQKEKSGLGSADVVVAVSVVATAASLIKKDEAAQKIMEMMVMELVAALLCKRLFSRVFSQNPLFFSLQSADLIRFAIWYSLSFLYPKLKVRIPSMQTTIEVNSIPRLFFF